MVQQVLTEMSLIKKNTIVVQPKDLIGGNEKIDVIKKIFKAAKGQKTMSHHQSNNVDAETRNRVIILWFEDIDFICTANGKNLEMMYAFLAEIDQLQNSHEILILATTS